MVRSSDILTSFASLVGWRQPASTALGILPSSLSTATSGLYFNELSELISADVANDVKPEGLTLETYLTRITSEAISSVVNRYLVSISDYARSLVADETLFRLDRDTEYSYDTSFPGFVGLWVKARGYKCLTLTISQITLEFTEPQTVTLIVKGEDNTQISTHELAYTTGGVKQTFAVNITLPLDQDYRIGYNRESITGKAIVWDYIKLNSPYMDIRPFETKDSVVSHNYGLNIKYSLVCDLTDFFIKNKLSFARAIQLQVGITMMRAIMDSTNVVRLTQSDAPRRAEMLLVDFETRLGTNPLSKEPGEFDKIKSDFSGIDPICLPKVKTPFSIENLCR